MNLDNFIQRVMEDCAETYEAWIELPASDLLPVVLEIQQLRADNARLRDLLSRADAALDNCGIGAAAPVRASIKSALAEGGGK